MSDSFSDFAQELEQFLDFDTPRSGDIRSGTIVSISQQGAIVALDNIKRDGIVQNSDLNKLDDAERASLKVNDEVKIKVVNTSDPDSLIVSIFQARILEDWDRAEKLKESAELIEVEIGGYNKGGLIAPFGRLRGFIPLSQAVGFNRGLADRDRQRRMAKMRGEKIPVKVIEVDRQRRRLVFSQREGQREWDASRKAEFLSTISVGDVVKGRVRSIRDFGVFVDLGGADGLVHVSELAWHRVNHPREVVKTGDEIDVKVLKVDIEAQRISLSRKPLLVNPWTLAEENYIEGQLVEGTVVRLTNYGAFVELEPGVEGLLHITQLSRAQVEKAEEIVQEGEKHLLRVLTVDSARQRIRLSLKQVSATEQIEWMQRQQIEKAAAAEAAAAEEAAKAAAESEEVTETEDAADETAKAESVEDAPAVVEETEETVEATQPTEDLGTETETPAEVVTEVEAPVAEAPVEEPAVVEEESIEQTEPEVTEEVASEEEAPAENTESGEEEA